MDEKQNEPQPNVTPEEQRMYDAVMMQARGILFGKADDDQGFRIVLDKLRKGKQAIGETIGHTAAMVLMSVKKGVEKQGREVPGDILFHAGEEIIDDLLEIAAADKLMKETDTERVKKQAMFEAMRIAGQAEIDGGKVTPDKQAAAKAEMQAVLAQGKKPEKPTGIIDQMRKE